MTLHKEYHTLENGQVIKFTITFNRETVSWATSQPIEKGYRVSATPVSIRREEGFTVEEFGAFTGFNDTLLPVERQSAKRLEEAKKIMAERMQGYIHWFKEKYNL
jgi:hypothetical protein